MHLINYVHFFMVASPIDIICFAFNLSFLKIERLHCLLLMLFTWICIEIMVNLTQRVKCTCPIWYVVLKGDWIFLAYLRLY